MLKYERNRPKKARIEENKKHERQAKRLFSQLVVCGCNMTDVIKNNNQITTTDKITLVKINFVFVIFRHY